METSPSDLNERLAAAFEEPRADLAAELERALGELPAAREAAVAAKEAAEAAAHFFENVTLRARRAVPQGAEGAAPALRRVVEDARRARDQVAGRASLLKAQLDNLRWKISCLRDDLDQLDLAITPPPLESSLPETVKRAPPPGPKQVEIITFPLGPPSEAA